jgi:hypothetical protein
MQKQGGNPSPHDSQNNYQRSKPRVDNHNIW